MYGGRAALLCMALSAAACASNAPDGSLAAVNIETTPSGALARSEYGDACITPCRLSLPVATGGVINVAKDGFETRNIRVLARNAEQRTYYGDDEDVVLFALDTLVYVAEAPRRRPHLDTKQASIVLKPVSENEKPAALEAPRKEPAVIEPKLSN